MSFTERLEEVYEQLYQEDNVEQLVLPVPNIEVTTTNTMWANVKSFLKLINRPPKHFIEGWQLNLSGKPKSFVLEKQFKDCLPNLDVILSERHNHNGINEESVIYYAEEQIDTVVG